LLLGHVADVHLGARLAGFEELEGDVEEAFRAAMEALVREGAEAIVVSGDLFHTPRPPNRVLSSALRVIRWVAGDRGVPVILALGDHDYPQRGDRSPIHLLGEAAGPGVYTPPERFPESATALDVVRLSTIMVAGATFTLMPFIKGGVERRKKMVASLLDAARRLAGSLEAPRILVAHYGLKGYTIEDDAVAEEADLPPYEYAALGHVHRRHVARVRVEGGWTTMAYPSSLVPLNADEARRLARGEDRKGPLLVDLSAGEPVVHELEFEQPRIQATLDAVASSRRRLVEEALKALREAGWDPGSGDRGKPPVLHLALRIPPGPSLTPREAVEAIRRSLGVIVRLREARPLQAPGPTGGGGGEGYRSEVEVVKSLLDPRGRIPERAEELARLIVELKRAAARGDVEEAERLLEEVLSQRFDAVWSQALGRPAGLKAFLEGG